MVRNELPDEPLTAIKASAPIGWIIVGLFVATMGRRKLSEREGRFLKLLSGLMMLGLGLMLIFSPDRLASLSTAIVLIAGALILTIVIDRAGKRLAASDSK